jgi:hypothetical protein
MDQLHFTGEGMFREARIGAGLFIMCSDMQALMEAASVNKVLLNEKEISVIKRIVDGKALYFITNRNDKPVSKWITL